MTVRNFKTSSICLSIAAVLIVALLTSEAQADGPDVEICNNSSEKIFFSIAGFDSESDGFQWRSIGWWNLESDECTEMIIDRLLDRHIFVHGQSDTGYWRGEYLFCAHDEEAFDITGAYNCDDRGYGYEQRRYFHKTSDDGTFYVGFSD